MPSATASVGILVDSSGLFKEQKRYFITSSIINIVLSFFLVNRIGVPGVFLGTIVGSCILWFGRTELGFNMVLRKKRILLPYIIKNFFYLLLFLIMAVALQLFFNNCFFEESLINFFIKGFISIICICIIHFIIFRKTIGYRYLLNVIRRKIK